MKLHEALAINGSVETQEAKCRTDLVATFTSKHHLFGEKLVTFTSTEEGKDPKPVTEEQLSLQTTVDRELKWLSAFFTKAVDSSHQINVANMAAKADVILENGTILAKAVPATTLLELEKRLAELKGLLMTIPTNDPAKGFAVDTNHKFKGVWKSRELVRQRTRKAQRPLVLYEATDKHPAQVQLISEDIPIGNVLTQEWSGMISPSQKSDILDRCESLTRAVKAARSRANDTEVDKNQAIGEVLYGFVVDGVK